MKINLEIFECEILKISTPFFISIKIIRRTVRKPMNQLHPTWTNSKIAGKKRPKCSISKVLASIDASSQKTRTTLTSVHQRDLRAHNWNETLPGSSRSTIFEILQKTWFRAKRKAKAGKVQKTKNPFLKAVSRTNTTTRLHQRAPSFQHCCTLRRKLCVTKSYMFFGRFFFFLIWKKRRIGQVERGVRETNDQFIFENRYF